MPPHSQAKRRRLLASLFATSTLFVLGTFGLLEYGQLKDFSRAKLTMVNLKTAAAGLEVYGAIHGRYPTADTTLLVPDFGLVSDPSTGYLSRSLLAKALSRPNPVSGWPLAEHMRLSRLKDLLEHPGSGYPDLRIETEDGWGNPLLVGIAKDGRDYVVASGGSNGHLESTVSVTPYSRSEAWHDIVLADSIFVAGPDNTTW